MRSFLTALLFTLTQIGCSSSYIVSSSPNLDELNYSTFNSEVKDESAIIVRMYDSELTGRNLVAGSDSISWKQPKTDAGVGVPIPTVNKVVTKNHTIGALEGAGIAFLVGGATGLLAAVLTVGDAQGMDELAYAIFPMIGAGAGLLGGAIVGAVIGHSYEYEFNPDPVSP